MVEFLHLRLLHIAHVDYHIVDVNIHYGLNLNFNNDNVDFQEFLQNEMYCQKNSFEYCEASFLVADSTSMICHSKSGLN